MATTPPIGRHRLLIIVTLVIACLGAVVPFGFASDKQSTDISTLEWILAGLALVALVGLVVELVGRFVAAWPFMVTGFVWATIAAYLAIIPDATFLWHLSHTLVALAFAFLALTAWRVEARGVV
jgi:hypothetical protein